MGKIRVACDLDGVIWDMVKRWLEYYKYIAHEEVKPEDIKTYQIAEYVKHPEVLPYILEMENFWNYVELYDGAYDAIERMQNNPEIDLVIATATDYKVARKKFDRLFKLLPMLDKNQLVIGNRKDLLNVDFMIDDWECNLRNVDHESKMIPILITRSYNASFPERQYGIYRAKDLQSAVNAIEKYVETKKFEIK